MKLKPIRHEDDRRVLTEYISGIPFKRAKVLEVKQKSILGKHYHRENDSVFFLFKGSGRYFLKPLDGAADEGNLAEGECLFVPRNVIHAFELDAGSVMLETASEIYDKNDEIQVT